MRLLASAGLISLSPEEVEAYEERRRRGEAPGFAGVFWAGLKECWSDPGNRTATAVATAAVAVVASAKFWPPAEVRYHDVIHTTTTTNDEYDAMRAAFVRIEARNEILLREIDSLNSRVAELERRTPKP